jgi:carbon starvation protein
VAPAIDMAPEGAPPLLPFVFIIIACGAISGFHGLVSSGTTAKQIDREPDARFIAYGGMIGESLLGLAAVLACTAGF